MTPAEALQNHLAQRPEMPRPYRPDSAAAIAWQRAFQAWVTEKHSLEIEDRVAGLVVPAHDHNRPSCTPKADYDWRRIHTRRRTAA